MCEKYSQRAMIGNKYCKHLFFEASVKTSNVRILNIFLWFNATREFSVKYTGDILDA